MRRVASGLAWHQDLRGDSHVAEVIGVIDVSKIAPSGCGVFQVVLFDTASQSWVHELQYS